MLGETGTRKATYAIQVACQAWSKSHERCHVRLARDASSQHTARCKVHKKQSTIKASTPTMTIVFYSCNRSTYRHGSDTTVGFLLSPYFGQRRSWAVIKMGLEDTCIQRVVESASCVDLG